MADWTTFFLILAFVCIVALLLVSIWMYRRLQLVFTFQHHQQQMLRDDVEAFIDSTVGLGRKLSELEMRINDTAKRQSELEHSDPHDKSYLQAAKMLAMGGEIQDIMETCQLSQAEAELMKIMQKSQQQAWEELESEREHDEH